MNFRWILILTSTVLVVLVGAVYFHSPGLLEDEIKYEIRFFQKRYWCPDKKQFGYDKVLDNVQEEELSNYYAVRYFKGTDTIAIESSHRDFDTPVGSWFYYNKRGQIVKELVYKKSKLVEKFIYSYNEHNKLKEQMHFIIQGGQSQLRSKSIYYYNMAEDNQWYRVKTENYNQGILDEYIQYEYDLKGRLSKRSVYILAGQLKNYFLYHYDKEDRLKLKEVYNRDGQQQMKNEFQYNALNKLAEERLYKNNNGTWLKLRQKQYHYSDAGWLSEVIVLENQNKKSSLSLVYRTLFGHNNKGCLIWEKRFDHQSRLVEEILF